jgi:hypothetical protein
MHGALAALAAADGREISADAMTEVERIWQKTLPMLGRGTYMQMSTNILHGVLPGSQMLLHYGKAYLTK